MAVMKVKTEGKFLWLRTITSTLVGEGVDSLLFAFIASLFGVFPWEIFASLVLTNYIFKVSVGSTLYAPHLSHYQWIEKSRERRFLRPRYAL